MLDVSLPMPDFVPGSVWLVGAGPGDPGLLTLYALHALRRADVVLHDALVDPRVLALAGPDTRLEHAGKRGHCPSPSQPEISARLVALAGRGLRVCRLKGGDPFVFGRGAEEALALVDANVPFRVVPGVTAGIGGLAYAGIPVTSRDTNSAVTFITGHDRSGALPGTIDWEALAKSSPVMVFYMALRHVDAIAGNLLAAGRRPDEPVAVVSRAATPHQEVIVGTIADIGERARTAALEPPAMLVVGEVVRLRERLAWS